MEHPHPQPGPIHGDVDGALVGAADPAVRPLQVAAEVHNAGAGNPRAPLLWLVLSALVLLNEQNGSVTLRSDKFVQKKTAKMHFSKMFLRARIYIYMRGHTHTTHYARTHACTQCTDTHTHKHHVRHNMCTQPCTHKTHTRTHTHKPNNAFIHRHGHVTIQQVPKCTRRASTARAPPPRWRSGGRGTCPGWRSGRRGRCTLQQRRGQCRAADQASTRSDNSAEGCREGGRGAPSNGNL